MYTSLTFNYNNNNNATINNCIGISMSGGSIRAGLKSINIYNIIRIITRSMGLAY